MRLGEKITSLYKQLLDAAEQTRVILLHPDSRYRSPLVARILEAQDHHVLYYALGPDDIDVESFVDGLTHDLANQRLLFGRHLNVLGWQDRVEPDQVIEAFVRELNDIRDKPVFLIFDEYDRSDSADEVQQLIYHLSNRLPEHCRLVINSRTMPRLPWIAMIAQGRALILLDDEIVDHNFYGEPCRDALDLEVFGLGPGFVVRSGKLIDAWEGHLPRLLFFFALDKPVVTRSEICRAFWPELDVDQAVNVFHVTKRRLHKAMEFEIDILEHEEGYYRISPQLSLDYDVMHFVTALMAARAHARERPFELWRRVVDLYRGPYLQGHNDAWILERRRDYRAGYIEALNHMAKIRLGDERPEHALSLLLRASDEDPLHSETHQQILRLYSQLGRRSEAAEFHHRVVENLNKAGLALDADAMQAYTEIMR